MRRTLLLCVIYFLCDMNPCVMPLWAADFGLVMDLNVGAGDSGANGLTGNKVDFSGILIPMVSIPLGDAAARPGEIFVSVGVKADYELESWSVIPELLRTEFSMSFNDLEVRLGRMQYTDPLGFIADGLFDGARLTLDTTGAGTFSFGSWYTGLLSKKRINITMTGKEFESFYAETDYSDFDDTYFAPRRFIISLGWEHLGLGEIVRAKLAFISQSDLSDANLHSQYLAAKLTVPVKAFVFDLGGCLEMVEGTPTLDDGGTGLGMAGEIGIGWNLPSFIPIPIPIPIEDKLSFTGRFSSGVVEDNSVTAFLPVTTMYQGDVLKAKLSGLSKLSLDYIARLYSSFSAGLSSSYFVRSDLGTYSNYGTERYFLGNEFFGRLIWSPVSDIQINLGGGVFLPSTGDVSPDSNPLWRVEVNVILALY